MKKATLLIIVSILSYGCYAQVFSTPGGMVADNGSQDHVLVTGMTELINPNGRTLTLERDNGDSWIMFHDPDNYWYSMGIDQSNNGAFVLNVGPDPGYATQFTMTSTGNVGIGTAAPDARLSVKGHIHAQEVRVDLNGAVAPDYVFESGYDLMSIDRLAAYIMENKHLPEIPSASDMETNGLNLKEMNLMLLKKVEELTLHLIEQNRINKMQAEKIGRLEEDVEELNAR